MKLIRNLSADGSCKYALILLAKLTEQDAQDIVRDASEEDIIVEVPSDSIFIGNESPESQFFVLKYRDIFAVSALNAYAEAVMEFARGMNSPAQAEHRAELIEYAMQVQDEARKASALGDARQIPD